MKQSEQQTSWKEQLHEIIYEADTKAGKLFDVVLLIAILVSISLVMLESVDSIDAKYHNALTICEWVITILFTIEYLLRILSIKKPTSYIFSFYGIIDLLSMLPKYISLFIVGSHHLVALRALRLLRIFRILKLVRYISASNKLVKALKESKDSVAVFLFFVSIICIILGTIMYLIEGAENGFTSIPRSVYWAVVTLTTVGYGDIAPQSALGQFIASIIMILGYAIIAISTGIFASKLSKEKSIDTNTQVCPHCNETQHKDKAIYCHFCGHKLN